MLTSETIEVLEAVKDELEKIKAVEKDPETRHIVPSTVAGLSIAYRTVDKFLTEELKPGVDENKQKQQYLELKRQGYTDWQIGKKLGLSPPLSRYKRIWGVEGMRLRPKSGN